MENFSYIIFISGCVKINQKLRGGEHREHDHFITLLFSKRKGNFDKKYELGVPFSGITFI
jgi:hypothetical protein